MDHYTLGSMIFLVVVSTFLLVWFKKGFIQAVMISSAITSLGVLILPDRSLYEVDVQFLGTWYRYTITLNFIKIFFILVLIVNYLFYKKKGEKYGVDL